MDLCIVIWHVSALDLVVQLRTGIGSFLPIPCRSLLIHAFYTLSAVVFFIDRALAIQCVRVIWKFSRYTLVFYGLLFSYQFTGQIDWHALV